MIENKIFWESVWIDNLKEVSVLPLIDECYRLKETDPSGVNKSNQGGWQSQDICNLDNFQKCFTAINGRLQGILDQFLIKDIYVAGIAQCWININPTNSYNSIHSHPRSFLSGVFYIQGNDSDQGCIVFEDSQGSGIREQYLFDDMFCGRNGLNTTQTRYPPITGNLIIFPSWLRHQVDQNLSQEDRISISFNIILYNREALLMGNNPKKCGGDCENCNCK